MQLSQPQGKPILLFVFLLLISLFSIGLIISFYEEIDLII